TGMITSKHLVTDVTFYEESYRNAFAQFYGNIEDYAVLALLPSYLERKNSSLVYMVQHFIEKSQSDFSGFFLHNVDELVQVLKKLAQAPEQPRRKVLLIGVTFALLDLAESRQDWSFLRHIPELIVMETGGMKGRREELLREEVHEILTQAFQVDKIHSEYGMTELLSQAYSKGQGVFSLPPTMRILLRDVNDPFAIDNSRKSGGINVVDLANIDSCAFIETKDLGSLIGTNGDFRVLGRFDNSDIRGCNLMLG
ncbi:MAG: acyl transferase, partial [Bacteroidota bacterium]